jgi:hypothetical protein
MTDINRYALMLEALSELKTEVIPGGGGPQTQLAPSLPPLSEVLSDFGPMPHEALFLGVASDGLPVLLNLYDPIPGPILIPADPGSGKSAFLQLIAAAVGKMHQPENIQFAVITNHPDEWNSLGNISNCVGVFKIGSQGAADLILSLASWAHANRTIQQSVLLMIDGLDSMMGHNADMLQNLRWLFLRGPARRAWPFISLNTQRVNDVLPWLDLFHTRIFGKVNNPKTICMLDAEKGSPYSLDAGVQFTLRERDHWLRFWLPTLAE